MTFAIQTNRLSSRETKRQRTQNLCKKCVKQENAVFMMIMSYETEMEGTLDCSDHSGFTNCIISFVGLKTLNNCIELYVIAFKLKVFKHFNQ